MKRGVWRTHERSPHAKAIRNLDDALSIMVRARDEELPCILFEANECDHRNDMQCGHFIQREPDCTPARIAASVGRTTPSGVHVIGGTLVLIRSSP